MEIMTKELLKSLIELQEVQVENYKESLESERSFSNPTRISTMESLLLRFEAELNGNKKKLILMENNITICTES